MNTNYHLLKTQVQDHLSQLRSQAELRRELSKQRTERQRASVQITSLKPASEPQL